MKTRHYLLMIFSGLFMALSYTGYGQQVKEVNIKGLDKMRYSVEEITASPGQKIRLTLTTVSNLPKAQMSHNFVLLKKDADPSAFVSDGLAYPSNEYIDDSWSDDIIVKTKLLGAGESDTVEFTAPKEKGTYTYVCTFPGHFQAGMKGSLTVQ
ncbi:MAG TPA: plastocyanin/azurin family copper-binding protein [Bacteroidales bacterium]|nr:plastocyanin/azurin family copper-binding protein [Bacteroidales bacterium]